MAARLLPRDAPTTAEPMRWPTLQSGALIRTRTAGTAPVDGPNSAAMQARIAELESELTQRTHRAYQDGESAGVKHAAAQLTPVINRMAQAIEDLATVRTRLRREAESDLVRLSLAVARRILHRELTVDPEALGGIVRSALDRLEAREVNRIRVHPVDAPLIEQSLSHGNYRKLIEIISDPALERGAAIFETSRGQFDASVDTQLQEIERGFADVNPE